MVHEDLQFDEIKKVDNPIPHIEFVIPKEFHEVEYKVYLFSMLQDDSSTATSVMCRVFILLFFKTQGQVFSNQGSMM